MPAPSDLNSRIALAKGWTWHDNPQVVNPKGVAVPPSPYGYQWTHWRNPHGYWCTRPDYMGTLAGVAGMMRELNANSDDVWRWWYNKRYQEWWCTWAWQRPLAYTSPDDRPGDCVGDAWLSEHEKEKADD